MTDAQGQAEAAGRQKSLAHSTPVHQQFADAKRADRLSLNCSLLPQLPLATIALPCKYSCAKFLSLAVLFSFALFMVGGCALAVGPGYTIHKQNLELRFIPSPEPHLAVHGVYQTRQFRRSTPRSYSYYSSSLRSVSPPRHHRFTGTIKSVSPQEISPASLSETGRHHRAPLAGSLAAQTKTHSHS